MSRGFLALACVLAFVSSTFAQTSSDPNEGARLSQGASNTYDFSWWSRSGRSYFLQHSEDLMSWTYFPDVIEAGVNGVISYGFDVSGPDRYFVRLKYTDLPTNNILTSDFDGDFISSLEELQMGLDPLNSDSDNDGISDSSDPFPLLAATGTAPQISILSPQSGSTTANSTVTVTAQVTANRALDEVRINSVLAPGSGNQFERTVSFAEGTQEISVYARTVEGRTSEVIIPIIVDAFPSDITIESPADSQVFTYEHVRVRVRVEALTDSVTLDGQATSLDGLYRYGWVVLQEGDNTITATVTDSLNRQNTDSVTVSFSPPTGYDSNADDDGDGVANGVDLFPDDPSESQDSDSDGVGDNDDADNSDPTNQNPSIAITAPANGMVIQAK